MGRTARVAVVSMLLPSLLLSLAVPVVAAEQQNAPPLLQQGRVSDNGKASLDLETVGGHSQDNVVQNFVRGDGNVWAALPRLGSFRDDGEEVVYCRAVQWVRVPPQDRADRVSSANSGFLGLFMGLPELQGHDPYLSCPIDPTEAIPPVVVQDAVIETIEDQLPRPTLEVPPGYALTGMPAYLVTNHQLEYGPVTHSVDLGIMVVDVTVTASGATHVDWGDGHAETYHSPGTPWPDGEVRHTYIDTGTVTITVTDTWEVTYRVPALGIEDSVTAPLAPRTLDDLEIQQVQAVRTSSDG